MRDGVAEPDAVTQASELVEGWARGAGNVASATREAAQAATAAPADVRSSLASQVLGTVERIRVGRRWDEAQHPRDGHGKFTAGGDSTDGTANSPGSTVGGSAQSVAEQLVAHATAVEPALTSHVSGLVTAQDGTMAGLEFRVKTSDSLADKIQKDVTDTGNTPAEVGAKMFDVNRYTGVFPEAQYAEHSQAVIDSLRDNGNHLTVKNYWNVPTNPYQGINVQVTNPQGQRFELQFHTDTSLSVKEGELHDIYKLAGQTTSQSKIQEYTTQSFRAAAKIPVPPGVSSVR